MKGQTRSRCRYNLLLFRSCELSENSLGDGGGRLERQAVHKQRGGCSHDFPDTQKACAASKGSETMRPLVSKYVESNGAGKAACRNSSSFGSPKGESQRIFEKRQLRPAYPDLVVQITSIVRFSTCSID